MLKRCCCCERGLECEQVCKGNKSGLCCFNRELGIEEIALCEGAAASNPCCEKTTCTFVQVNGLERLLAELPLLGSSDTALLAIKTGSSACHCWNHSHYQTPKANTANYFSMPIPNVASQCPFILIFSLSSICLPNNTPPHFPAIPYPLCLLLYSHGLSGPPKS